MDIREETEQAIKYTTKLNKQRRAAEYHSSVCCELLSDQEQMDNYPLYIEKDNLIFVLDKVIKNNRKSCPAKHAGPLAEYKLFKGAINYDYE